ncbi:MAG: pilus assembly protein [bacterium]
MKKLISRFWRDESGTTISEFVITLPIFIMCFVGTLQLGMFNEKSVKTWARAHKNTFEQAIPVSKNRFSVMHMQPTVGAGLSAAGLAFGNKPIHQSGVQRGLILAAEGTTYLQMGLKGHWGESATRTWPVDQIVNMRYVEGYRSSNSSTIIGNSKLAKDLLDESVGNFSGSGGGALGAINALLSGSGVRPAMAAGQRYGAVFGFATDNMNVAGYPMSFRAHFNTLVPPFPLKGFEAAAVPTGVVRITMEGTSQYKEILGIKWSQPYPGGSRSVPTFNWPTPY